SGWYDEEEEGERIYDTTTVEEIDDHVIYAYWGEALSEGDERISPDDVERIHKAEPASVTAADKKVKISKKVSVTLTELTTTCEKNATTYTGKKIDIKNALKPDIDVTSIMQNLESLRKGTTKDDIFKFDYITKNINAGAAEYYGKLSVKAGAKNYMSRPDYKKFKKLISGANAALKKKPCEYWINPVSITSCDPAIVAKFKSGAIQVKDDGSLKSVKKVTVTINGKTYKLKKAAYSLLDGNAENNTVRIQGKGNFTGKLTVEVRKK
nr:hypothetical protein [Lachnospiraceae bacterium]